MMRASYDLTQRWLPCSASCKIACRHYGKVHKQGKQLLDNKIALFVPLLDLHVDQV
jgi:hypothetical protein